MSPPYTDITPDESYNTFMLSVPFVKQDPEKCAVAALATIFGYYGIEYSGIERIYSKTLKGTKLISVVNFANRYLNASALRMGYADIVRRLRMEEPLILMKKLGAEKYHYYVVKGFVGWSEKLIVNDGYHEDAVLQLEKDKQYVVVVFST